MIQFEDFALLLQKDNRLDETQKQWSRNQDTKEIVKKPRPRRNGREKNGR